MQTTNPTNDKNAESSIGKHGLVCLMKRLYPSIAWYILGVATPFIVVLIIFGIRPPKSKSEILVDKWHLKDCNETFLLVNVPVEPNAYITVGVERNPKTGWLKEVGIMRGGKLVPDTAAFFMYKTKGNYNTPMAYYGFTERGLVWRDLNFDSRFDQRIDYQKKLMEINIKDVWVPGKRITETEVKTDRGTFHFDPNTGWLQDDANLPDKHNQ